MRLKKTTTTETTWTIKREPLFNRNPLAVSSDCCWCCAVVGQRCMHELFKEKDIKSKYTHIHRHTHRDEHAHSHTQSTCVHIWAYIFYVHLTWFCCSCCRRRMATRLSNWKFLLPPRLLQFRGCLSSFHCSCTRYCSSPSRSSCSCSSFCCCCCCCWRSKF